MKTKLYEETQNLCQHATRFSSTEGIICASLKIDFDKLLEPKWPEIDQDGPIQDHFEQMQAGILGKSFFDMPMDFHFDLMSDKISAIQENTSSQQIFEEELIDQKMEDMRLDVTLNSDKKGHTRSNALAPKEIEVLINDINSQEV